MNKNVIVDCLLFTTGFISFCSNSGMCSGSDYYGSDYYSIFKISYDTSTPASRAMDKCVNLLKNGGEAQEVIDSFKTAFGDVGDDPGYYSALRKLLALLPTSDALLSEYQKSSVDSTEISTKDLWEYDGLIFEGYEYLRELPNKCDPTKFVDLLKKAFLQS